MNDPSRAAGENAEAESRGPLDPTQALNTVPELKFAAPEYRGELGTFGRYRVLQKLGQGGMGAVYLGFDASLDRKVALKVMLPQYAGGAGARERFLREARAAAKIKSDHVVTIFDVGDEGGSPFIAMEYLLGSPLDRFLKTRGNLPLEHALRVARETALGLAAAHDLGLVHRDIKPANIWLEAPHGRVKILDFGLARAANDDAHLTGSGAVMGTPAYMSPEQGRGHRVDARSDLFSLGVVLYRLCTGKMPFTGDGAMAVLTSLAVDTPADPRALNPQLPEAVEAIITKLLAKSPAERFQTARDVAEALRAVATGPLPAVVAVPVPFAVGAQTQNVWADIADSGSVAVPLAEAADADDPAPRPVRQKLERSASKVPLLAACAAVLLAAVAVGAVLMWPKKKPGAVAVEGPTEPLRPGGTSPGPGPGFGPPRSSLGKVYPLPGDLVAPVVPVRPKEVFSLDYLDPTNPKHVPPEEKFDWQPKELVAVLGSHRQRLPTSINQLVINPGGTVVLADGYAIDIATRKTLDWPKLSAFSPDGRRAAQGNKVWEIGDLKKPPVEYPNVGAIQAFLTDDIVLTTGASGYVVWKLDPKESKPLTEPIRDVFSWAMSNGRRYLALIGNDQSCRVFDITSTGPKEKFTLPQPAGKVFTAGLPSCRASFSETGLLATADSEGRARVWDVAGPVAQLRYTVDEKGPAAVCFAPHGDRVIRGTDTEFTVWSLEGKEPQKLATPPPFPGYLRSLAVTPDGLTVIIGHADGTVRFWGIEKGVIFERNPIRPQPVIDTRADFSPDGRFAALRHENGRVHLWDLTEFKSRALDWPNEYAARFSPDGGTVAVFRDAAGGGLRLLPPARPELPTDFGNGCVPACHSPDGKWLAAVSSAGDLALFDVSVSPPREPFPRVPLNGFRTPFWRFTPDGRFLIAVQVSGGPQPTILRTWAVTPRGPVPRFESDSLIAAHSFALVPDGTGFLLSRGNSITSYDLVDGAPANPHEHAVPAVSLSVSPDGRLLLTGATRRLAVVDRATGTVLHEWRTFSNPIGMSFHPDGRHIFVTNGPDGVTYILRLPKDVLDRAADADRRAAEWVLDIGGRVRIDNADREIAARDDLPKGRFSLTGVELAGNTRVTDAGLACFKGCSNLTRLSIHTTPVTDAGLANFKDCTNLTRLALSRTRATDLGLVNFKNCTRLTYLALDGTQATDVGLANFTGCTDLEFIALTGTQVTDAAFVTLRAFKGLTQVAVQKTNVTGQAVAEFRKAMPQCKVVYDDGPIDPKK